MYNWHKILYVTSDAGVQIFNQVGEFIGTIQLPTFAANLSFGGTDMKTLYLTSGNKVYSLKMNVPGVSFSEH